MDVLIKENKLAGLFLKIFSEKGQKYVANTISLLKKKRVTISLPGDFFNAKRVLVILPEEEIEALHQLENVISLVNFYNNADITFLCNCNVPAFYKNLKGVSSVLQYIDSDLYIFSRKYQEIAKKFRDEYFDICFFLERNPRSVLKALLIKTGAPIRMAYGSDSFSPFSNIHIRLKRNLYRSDQNLVMSRIIGASCDKKFHWVIPRDIDEEMKNILQECRFSLSRPVTGIDAEYFMALFGKEWFFLFFDELLKGFNYQWYLYFSTQKFRNYQEELQQKGIPVFCELSSSKTAALISRSDLIVSGKSQLYVLSCLLGRKAIGVFHSGSVDTYFKKSKLCKKVVYGDDIQTDISKNIIAAITDFSV